MADYISREAAIAEIKDESGCDSCWAATREMCKTMCHTRKKIDRIIAIPAADVRPVVRGNWIDVSENHKLIKVFWCDQCGEETTDICMGEPRANFCPNCGADMRQDHGNKN